MDKLAFVSLTFDDGLRCQFDQAVPILDKYDFPATFFLIANTLPSHERPEWRKIEWNAGDIQLLKSMAQRGHEIGSHSVSHKFPNPNADFDPTFEAEESKRLIEGWMGMEIPSFCYPFCQKPDPLKKAVEDARYKQARAGSNGSFCCPAQDPVDWFDLDCRMISPNEDVSAWIRSGCWYTLMFHGIGTEQDGWGHISVTEFARQMAELAKYRDSGSVEVVTFKDGADRLRHNLKH
jgi:peptidoglycan/xylan/chitin deacetylase (PgdA/CDA1 family)